MNLLYMLLFSKAMHSKKINPRHVSRIIRKEARFWVRLITELVQLIKTIIKFIFVGISIVYKKCFCQETVEDELPENIIDINEYKLRKAK